MGKERTMNILRQMHLKRNTYYICKTCYHSIDLHWNDSIDDYDNCQVIDCDCKDSISNMETFVPKKANLKPIGEY